MKPSHAWFLVAALLLVAGITIALFGAVMFGAGLVFSALLSALCALDEREAEAFDARQRHIGGES